MAGILGDGSKTNASTITKYTQIQLQTSAQGIPIPLLWGKKRMGDNCLWSGDFKAVAEKGGKKGGGGGKGAVGGKGGGGAVYDYFVAVILGLCEGPITGIDRVWADKDVTTLAALGLTPFVGTSSQAPWAYLTANHPSEAISYAQTAYLANSRYSLGKSPNLPQLNFEIITPLSGSMPGTDDVNFGDVIPDFLTNPQYSIGIASSMVGGSGSLPYFKNYCTAQGLFFSPDVTAQEQVSSILDRWATLTNSWIFWSGAELKFVPLADQPVIGNGATYSPVVTPIFNFTYDDFISSEGDPPITVTRSDPADAPNHVKLECKDRTNSYNSAVIEWKDQTLIDLFGMVDSSVTQAYEICDLNVGQMVAQLVGQRGAYIRNTYDFKIGWEYGSLLEPGDIVSLTDIHVGLDAFPVRIQQLSEDEDGAWAVTAEEFPAGVSSSLNPQRPQPTTNTSVDFNVDPGDTNPPGVVEPSSALTGGAQVWLGASGGGDWGGCIVYISFDGVNYNSVGSISSPALQGRLTASLANHIDPDTVNTLSLDTTVCDQAMPTDATTDDADAFRTLAWITAPYTTLCPSNGELIAYGSVTATGTFTDDVTYLRRGLYGTAPASHASGDFVTRLDLNATVAPGNTVLIVDLPDQYVGQTIFFKLPSFNRFGQSVQDLSSAVAYQYTPTGAGATSTAVPIYQQISGAIAANQVLIDYVATVNLTLPQHLTGSFAGIPNGGVSNTSTQVYNLFKNGVNIGTATLAAGASPGANSMTFSFASDVTFVPGDHFKVVAPAGTDATLRSLFFSFLATSP
jgi:hypothetical protein